MAEPLLMHAHNVYEQQAHNRRMTWLLMIAFMVLIAVIGAGFDIFLDIGPLARIIILPFVILMAASGMWNFRKRASAGLWKKPQAFADEDDDDSKIFWWSFYIIGTPFLLLILIPMYFIEFNPRPLIHFFSQYLDISFLRYVPIGTVFAVIIGIVAILTSLHWGRNSILWSVHAEQPDESVADLPELMDVVKEMSLAAGLPCPNVSVVKDSDPNAFTIGATPSDSSIVVTTGLLTMLDREELQGVIAHEISHIRNSDTRLMTKALTQYAATEKRSFFGKLFRSTQIEIEKKQYVAAYINEHFSKQVTQELNQYYELSVGVKDACDRGFGCSQY